MAPKSTTAYSKPSSKKASSKVASSAKKTKALISKVDAAPVASKVKAEKKTKGPKAKPAEKTELTVKKTQTKKGEEQQTKKSKSQKRATVDPVSDQTDEDEEMGDEKDDSGDEAGEFKGISMEDSSDEDEDEEEGGAGDYLKGFSDDDGEDSSDDDDDDGVDRTPVDLGKLPTIAKDDETVRRKLERAKAKGSDGEKGVVSISRLPHGFYEDQLKAYFSQFGDVSRLRVARNKKTGASKHYAFLEFPSPDIATIVAETMNNYLIHGHILQCAVVPKDKVHPDLWIGANRKWRVVPRERVVRGQHNKPRTEEERAKVSKRLLKRQAQKKRKLEEAGIKYAFEKASYKKSKAVAAA